MQQEKMALILVRCAGKLLWKAFHHSRPTSPFGKFHQWKTIFEDNACHKLIRGNNLIPVLVYRESEARIDVHLAGIHRLTQPERVLIYEAFEACLQRRRQVPHHGIWLRILGLRIDLDPIISPTKWSSTQTKATVLVYGKGCYHAKVEKGRRCISLRISGLEDLRYMF